MKKQQKQKKEKIISPKSKTTLVLLSLFLGHLGVDRFYGGKIYFGFLKLGLTLCLGLGLIWWFFDFFFALFGAQKDINNHYIKK